MKIASIVVNEKGLTLTIKLTSNEVFKVLAGEKVHSGEFRTTYEENNKIRVLGFISIFQSITSKTKVKQITIDNSGLGICIDVCKNDLFKILGEDVIKSENFYLSNGNGFFDEHVDMKGYVKLMKYVEV